MMKKMEIMEVGIIVTAMWWVSIIAQFMPSSAQQAAGCWDRIANCLTYSGAIYPEQCCPVLRSEMTNDKVCFCAIKPTVDQNSNFQQGLDRFFSMCQITATFDSFCSGISTSPPLHNQNPSLPPLRNYNPRVGSTPRLDSESSPSKGNKRKVIVPAVVVPLASVIVALVILAFYIHKRKRNLNQPHPDSDRVTSIDSSDNAPEFKNELLTPESLRYKMETLCAATNNFSSNNVIGRGGFGAVYKGILEDGQEIAVKRLSATSKQGDEEFKNEVLLLAKLQHKSLVKMMGFCLANNEKLLVYEFVPNRSLDYFLFGDSSKKGELNWSRRYNIIRGVAKGMAYLHEDSPTTIIHRDLKTANILLDDGMNPKIADFGLARVCSFDQTHVETSRIAGTHGYMAPEYMLHGKFSTKSDVYSFGMLMLEIISGRRVSNLFRSSGGTSNLLSYAWACWLERKPLGLVDPTLTGGSYSIDDVIKCIHLGLLCVQEEISKRPTMSDIVQALKRHSVSAETNLSAPQPPSFMFDSSSNQITGTTNTSSATGSQTD